MGAAFFRRADGRLRVVGRICAGAASDILAWICADPVGGPGEFGYISRRGRGTASLGLVVKVIDSVTGFIAVALVAGCGAARAADDFPLTGSYTQNVPCKGDGSDPREAQVKISPQEIDSRVGVCTFLDIKRNGSSISARIECRFGGGPLMGDVTFTMRADKTIEFIDRDKNYGALLYRCPK